MKTTILIAPDEQCYIKHKCEHKVLNMEQKQTVLWSVSSKSEFQRRVQPRVQTADALKERCLDIVSFQIKGSGLFQW